MKIYNILNGIFYGLYGLLGAALPIWMSGILGFDLDQQGLHEFRAHWLAIGGLGLLLTMAALTGRDQKLLTMAVIIVTLCLAAGHCLGMLLDGTGQSMTQIETAFEIFWAGLGAFLLRRANKKAPA